MTPAPVRRARCAAAALAWVACAAPGTPGAAPLVPATGPIAYAPGTIRYRHASYRHVEQQAGGQARGIDEVLVYFLSAELVRQGDRMTVSLTVDSVPRYQTAGPAAGLAERARGATFTGVVAPNGEITNVSGGDSTNKLLQQLAEELTNLYPRTPASGAEPRAQWSDTTQTTSKSGGLPLAVVAVSRHEAGTPPDSGADRVLPIRTLTTYSFSGSGAQGGKAYSVQGEGRRHTVERLSLDGRYLGMTSADTSTYTISLRGLEGSLPGRQTRADTLSVIP